jgi:hypothetical protein
LIGTYSKWYENRNSQKNTNITHTCAPQPFEVMKFWPKDEAKIEANLQK